MRLPGSFHTRLFITLSGGACVFALAILSLVGWEVTRSVEENERQGLELTRNAFLAVQDRYESELLQQARLVSDLPHFRAAMATFDPVSESPLQAEGLATISHSAERILSRLDADFLVLTDYRGNPLVSAEKGAYGTTHGTAYLIDDTEVRDSIEARRSIDARGNRDGGNRDGGTSTGATHDTAEPGSADAVRTAPGEAATANLDLARLRSTDSGESSGIRATDLGRGSGLHPSIPTPVRNGSLGALRGIALRAMATGYASGIVNVDNGLQYASAVSLGNHEEAFGTLVMALKLDDALLTSLENMTGSGIALVSNQRILSKSPTVPALNAKELSRTKDYHTLIVPLDETSGSSFVVMRSKDRALRFLAGIRTGVMSMALIAVILASILAYFLARQLTTPIKRLVDHTELLAGGDLDAKVHINSHDELAVLAQAFNRMGQNLKESRRQLMQAGKMAALGEVSAGLAHELKQPLASIRGFSQLIAHTVDKGQTPSKEHTQIILDTVDHMVEVIQGLKDFSRRTDFTKKEIDIGAVLRRTATLMQAQLNSRQLKLELQVGDDLAPVLGEPNQLQQVFTNLIANARDALGERGHIRVSARAWDGQPFIQVTVADDGPGIPHDVLPHIFDSFFTTKEEGEGTGLGLHLSQNIVHDHGGRIEVQSQPGKGTVFKVLLPTADNKLSQSETRRAA